MDAREVEEDNSHRSEGRRTVTQLDDLLLRTAGRLAPTTVGVVAVGVYLVFGVGLPLLLNLSRVAAIAWGGFGAAWATVIVLCLFVTTAQAAHRRHLIEWTTDLRKLDATEFEWLVGEILRREGWNVTEVGRQGAPDGGIDLRAERGGQLQLVQCKRWTSYKVGVDEVRTIAGTASVGDRRQAQAVLVTLSSFTDAATDEAEQLRVQLVDGRALVERIERVRRSESCPACGTPMLLDRSPRGWWLRCPRYPNCGGKRDLGPSSGTAVHLLLEPS